LLFVYEFDGCPAGSRADQQSHPLLREQRIKSPHSQVKSCAAARPLEASIEIVQSAVLPQFKQVQVGAGSRSESRHSNADAKGCYSLRFVRSHHIQLDLKFSVSASVNIRRTHSNWRILHLKLEAASPLRVSIPSCTASSDKR